MNLSTSFHLYITNQSLTWLPVVVILLAVIDVFCSWMLKHQMHKYTLFIYKETNNVFLTMIIYLVHAADLMNKERCIKIDFLGLSFCFVCYSQVVCLWCLVVTCRTLLTVLFLLLISCCGTEQFAYLTSNNHVDNLYDTFFFFLTLSASHFQQKKPSEGIYQRQAYSAFLGLDSPNLNHFHCPFHWWMTDSHPHHYL